MDSKHWHYDQHIIVVTVLLYNNKNSSTFHDVALSAGDRQRSSSTCCLSNAMHGQNVNLPVCVCVCVSVTLSVNLPTGQTSQRIFTVDSLKDADLCKDVPFGGFDDE